MTVLGLTRNQWVVYAVLLASALVNNFPASPTPSRLAIWLFATAIGGYLIMLMAAAAYRWMTGIGKSAEDSEAPGGT